MDKNALSLAVFAVLCVLAGVLMGNIITKRPDFYCHGPKMHDFTRRAEHFMGYGPGECGWKRDRGPLEMLTATLELNADQKIKVTEILEKTRQEIDSIGKEVRESIASIKEKSDTQIMAVLNPGQQEKFKALQKEFKRNCGRRPCGPMRVFDSRSDETVPPLPQE